MGFLDLIKTIWHKKEIIVDKKADINLTSDFKYKTIIEPRFQDFDMMGHINNAVYFTFMEIGRTKYWTHAIKWDWNKTGVIIGSASIEYLQPIFPAEPLHMYIRTSRLGNSSFDLEYILAKTHAGNEVICSRGKTVCVAFDYTKKHSVPIPEIERSKMMAFEQLTETV